jgi:hypothetical protein
LGGIGDANPTPRRDNDKHREEIQLMQLTSASAIANASLSRDPTSGEAGNAMGNGPDSRFAQYKVIRRNGAVVGFEPAKISVAMTKAFLAVNGGQGAASARIREEVAKLTEAVVSALMKRKPEGGAIHIEEIQDQVELALMRGGEHEVARAYVLYREKRTQERAHEKAQRGPKAESAAEIIVLDHGISKPLDFERLTAGGRRIVRRFNRCRAGAHPEGDAEGPVQRRADGRGAQVRRARSAHADRKRPRLQLCHRPPVAGRDPL